MVQLEGYLYQRVKPVILSWNEPDIFAVSFFVYANAAYSYDSYTNVCRFDIGCALERYCTGAPLQSEERWDPGVLCGDDAIIDPADPASEGIRTLFQWYAENGVQNIGEEEDEEDCYDEDMQYVGKGPNGQYELYTAVANVARRLQEEKVLDNAFSKPIPIIIHAYEPVWYTKQFTEYANPNGQAADFLAYLSKMM